MAREWLLVQFYRHFPIIMIEAVTLLLSIGTISHGSGQATLALSLFGTVTLLIYCALLKTKTLREIANKTTDAIVIPHVREIVIYAVCTTAIAASLVHYISFNGMTLGAALTSSTAVEVALIRQGIIENLPTWMQYANAITIKTLLPIGLLLAVMYRLRAMAILTALFGAFYALCMLQKSGPVVLALPVLTYFVCTRRWIRLTAGTALVVLAVMILGFIANPAIQPSALRSVTHAIGSALPDAAPRSYAMVEKTKPPKPLPDHESGTASLAKAILLRVVMTPGDVVAQWFDLIPSRVPYGEGCGYRFLTPFLSCEFQNYASILYEKLYPEEYSTGLRGTVNAASMMTAYANFGLFGVVISAVLHGTLAAGLFFLFSREPVLCPAFNVSYLLLLSSSDLFTLLLSGGWGLAILLYIVLGREPRSR